MAPNLATNIGSSHAPVLVSTHRDPAADGLVGERRPSAPLRVRTSPHEVNTSSRTMAFDRNTGNQPLVDVKKRTTKVNVAVVIAVIAVLVAGVFTVWYVSRHPPSAKPDATERYSTD